MNDNARRLAERLLAVPASIDERERARDRLLDHYVRTTEAADDQVRGRSWAAGPEQFASRASALVWLDAERASLMAAVHMAAGADRDHAAMSLPLLMTQYLAWRRRFDDLLAVTRVSLDAARRLGDRGGQAGALSNLGIALHGLGRFGEAVTALQEAAVIFRETGNCRGEAKAANNLGLALRGEGLSTTLPGRAHYLVSGVDETLSADGAVVRSTLPDDPAPAGLALGYAGRFCFVPWCVTLSRCRSVCRAVHGRIADGRPCC